MHSILKERQHEISNNVVCATSKGSDQPAHMRSLIRAFASHLTVKLLTAHNLEFQSLKGSCTGSSKSTLCHIVGNLMPRLKGLMVQQDKD